jgi:hypothetical protein
MDGRKFRGGGGVIDAAAVYQSTAVLVASSTMLLILSASSTPSNATLKDTTLSIHSLYFFKAAADLEASSVKASYERDLDTDGPRGADLLKDLGLDSLEILSR